MSNPYQGLPPRAVTMVRELQRMGFDVVKSAPRVHYALKNEGTTRSRPLPRKKPKRAK